MYTSENWFPTKFRMVSSASCVWHILIILCVNVIFCISVYLYKWKWGLPLSGKKKYKPKQLTIRNEVSVNCVRHKSALTKQMKDNNILFHELHSHMFHQERMKSCDTTASRLGTVTTTCM